MNWCDVYIYIYIHIHTYTHMYINTYTHIHTCIQYVYIYIYICIYTYIHASMSLCIHHSLFGSVAIHQGSSESTSHRLGAQGFLPSMGDLEGLTSRCFYFEYLEIWYRLFFLMTRSLEMSRFVRYLYTYLEKWICFFQCVWRWRSGFSKDTMFLPCP